MACTSAETFQWYGSPISIGGTLQQASSPLGFFSLLILYQESFRLALGRMGVRRFGNKNETKTNHPLR